MSFREFLELALSRTDLDWKRYLRSSIRRRVLRLCGSLGYRSLDAWAEGLDDNEDQRDTLLGLLSVPFSRFFRDRAVFGVLANRVLPALYRSKRADGNDGVTGKPGPKEGRREERQEPGASLLRTLKIWSAGCACGQEIYSVAMLVDPAEEVELFATDINPACLAHAQGAVFSEGTLRELPPQLRERYFEAVPAHGLKLQASTLPPRWRLRTEGLPAVRFLRHDLLEDAYPKEQDLILCRNAALTYFRGPALLRVAHGLETSLAAGGCLVLGKGESLPSDVAATFEEDPPGSCCFWKIAP